MHVCTHVSGKTASIASGKPFEAVDAADQHVADAALAELGQDLQPELRALGLLKPHPEHVTLALDGDAQREIAGAALHAPALANLQHQAVEEDHRIDVLQRPLLPRADVLDDRVGDAADQVVADLDAVELGQVRLDVTNAHPARVHRDDLLVKASEAPLALRHDLRRKAALAIARRLDPNRAMLGRQRLRRRPIPRIAGPTRRRLAVLIAEVLGQLGIHRALDQPTRQIGQQAAGPDDLLLAARPGEQLVDQLIAEPLADLLGQPLDRGARGARAAGIPLRSPSGLAPRDAGASS